jgi:hypothetical protein
MAEELMGEIRFHNIRSIYNKKVTGYRDEWTSEALCVKAKVPPYIFDTEDPDFPYLEEAMAVCGQCPVRKECLEYAVENMPTFSGVVGGQLFWYGKIVNQKPRRRPSEYNTRR